MNRLVQGYLVLVTGALLLIVFSSYSNLESGKTSEENIAKANTLSQVIESVRFDKDFDFAGEKLPMENFDTRERLETEILRNAYYHSSTLLNLKKTARFFPVIEPILKKNGVPDDFKYLAIAESNLSNPTSPAGAKGYWQFMRNTGLEYGLEINSEVDERMHIEKATEAACRLIKKYKEQQGSWTMAAAAYNMGSNGLNKEREAQKTDYYYDMNLNEETGKYIFRIMAFKEIMSSPQKYGFYLEEGDYYAPLDDYVIVETDTAIENLGDFASKYGTSYRMIKVFNPWLLTNKLVNKAGKKYEIKVPRTKF
ncbi:MAG: transglycosylase SLT domain-containing protein [Saprospiraceae bacterium]|nr:transglycosylase SLT domain-containing protein [Saprospiraceae bacterium]